MYTTIRYGHQSDEVLYIAFSDEDIETLMEKFTKEKEAGKIRGFEYFLSQDLDQAPHGTPTKTMSEALANMDEPAFEAARNIVDLDAAKAFFGAY